MAPGAWGAYLYCRPCYPPRLALLDADPVRATRERWIESIRPQSDAIEEARVWDVGRFEADQTPLGHSLAVPDLAELDYKTLASRYSDRMLEGTTLFFQRECFHGATRS
jgi:hypothetical protein